jgi:hypothetical protein
MTEHSDSTRQTDQPTTGPDALPAQPAQPAGKPTVYRGGAAFVGGLVVSVLCTLGIIDLLVESGTQDLFGAALLAVMATLAVAYGVYPAAYADANQLRVRNPFRTIILPWPAVTELSARLSFMAHTEQRRYTVWAIPVSLHERRKAERVRLRELNRADREARRQLRGSTRLSDIASPNSRRTDPVERLSYADQAVREMGDRREAYLQRNPSTSDQGPAPTAAVSLAWPMMGSICAAVLLAVLAGLL